MSERIRLLLVEDNAADAELAFQELERANIGIDARRVDTFADYWRELEAFRPHVILCDYSMPKFDGLEALRIARQFHPHIPFIFVSGTIGEESAVLALKNGAKDYVLKGNLLRLPAAVERALKETEKPRTRSDVPAVGHSQQKTQAERAASSRTRVKTQSGLVRPETKQRVARWREMAAAIAIKNPASSYLEIAQAIQRSTAGKRKGDVLPYSISTILKYIRCA